MATPANIKIYNAQMQHVAVVERYALRTGQILNNILDESDVEVQKIIRNGNMKDLNKLVGRISKKINSSYDDVLEQYKQDLRPFISNEVSFQNDVLRKNAGMALKISKPNTLDIRKALLNKRLNVGKDALGGGRTIAQYTKGLAATEIAQVKSGISIALSQGLSADKAADLIYNSKEFTPPSRITRNRLRATIRSGITEAQTTSALMVFRANKDIIEEYKYVATLDSRTSPYCQRLDGRVFAVEGDNPRPPQHFACRSTIVPVVKAFDKCPPSLRKAGVTPANRAAINGQVPRTDSYQNWLWKQNPAVQDKILGEENAIVFRKGEVPVSRLIHCSECMHMTAAQARRADVDISDGNHPRIASVGGVDGRVNDITRTIQGYEQLAQQETTREVRQFVNTQGNLRNTHFGRANSKNRVGEDFFDEDIGLWVKDDTITFDITEYNRELRLTEDLVGQRVLSRTQAKWLDDTSNSFSRTLDSNQRTIARQTLRKYVVRLNGKRRVGSVYQDFDFPTIDNPNSYLLTQLNSNARELRGRLAETRRQIQAGRATTGREIPIREVYEQRSVRLTRISDYEEELRVLGSSAANEQRTIDALARVGIRGLDENTIKSVTRRTVDNIAKGQGRVANSIADNLGQEVLEDVLIAAQNPGQRNSLSIGYSLIEEFEGTLPFQQITTRRRTLSTSVVNKSASSAETRVGRFVEMELTEIHPTSNKLRQYTDDLENERRFSTLPQGRDRLSTAMAGDTVNDVGTKYKNTSPTIETDVSLTGTEARQINAANSIEYSVDSDQLYAYRRLSEDYPDLLHEGGYWNAEDGLTAKFTKLVDTAEFNKDKDFGFFHGFDFRDRIYPRSSVLNYQGDQFDKGILNFANKKPLGETGLQRLSFVNSENIGAQTIKGRRVSLDTVRGRELISESYRPRLERLGEAILSENAEDFTRYARVLNTVDEPGLVLRDAIEFARLRRHRNNGGTIQSFNSNYRAAQDATASAVQYAALMTRSRSLARASNLTNNSRKLSAYSETAKRVVSTPFVRNDALLTRLTEEQWTKILKHPVMTTLYGVTGTGRARQIRAALTKIVDRDPELREIAERLASLTDRRIVQLTRVATEAIDAEFPELGGTLRFLQNTGTEIAKTSGSVSWRQVISNEKLSYRTLKSEQVSYKYRDGRGRDATSEILRVSDEIDVEEAGRVFAPHYVHSQDADLPRYAFFNRGRGRNRLSLSTTHDSFSTHLGDYDRLNGILKDGYIAFARSNPFIKLLDDALSDGALTRRQYRMLRRQLRDGIDVDGNIVNIDPDKGTFTDFNEIRRSVFAFS